MSGFRKSGDWMGNGGRLRCWSDGGFASETDWRWVAGLVSGGGMNGWMEW
jgi:hypothetical protein